MDHTFWIILINFLFIALVYASVGFGGGSSYLALLAVMGVGFQVVRPTALLCNVVVVTGGAIIFYREGKLDFKKNLPLVLSSVPMAYLGGLYPIGERAFFIVLGFTLLVAALLLWFQQGLQRIKINFPVAPNNLALNVGLGGGVGFLSGLVGIGGGIFLSPILHLFKWDEPQKISATASFFILVNSLSGLAGQFAQKALFDWGFVLPLLASVFIGGQIGSRLGARKFNPIYIKRITAVLIFVAGINILLKYV